MKLDTFFDNFNLMADAPNGVQKLREMILQLAVQGKLVSQDPKDETASVLLERIKAKKRESVKEGKIKKIKPLPPVKYDEIHYRLPEGWEWTRLAEIGFINPRNEIDDETEVSFVPMKLLPTELNDRVESEICQWRDIKNGFTHFAEGDVALAKITPCFQNRKSAVMHGLKNGLGAGTTELHIFRPINDLIISEYVLLFLKTPKFISEGVSKMTGSAGQKRVPKTYFSETPFPLPPKNEQQRIVTKVDELMALCDELEVCEKQANVNCIQLNDASIHKLLASNITKKFKKHWQRICDNFDLLYSKPENVTKMRQAILQLAVQGKLVSQITKDEPASVLLEKIKAEKERLIKEKKIKKGKPLAPISLDEMPYKLPVGWEWVRFGVCFDVTSSKRIHVRDYVDKGIPFFRSKEIGELKNGLPISTDIFISYEKYNELKELSGFPSIGDLMLTSVGSIGNTWICDGREFYYKDGNITKIGSHQYADMRYVQYFIDSPLFTVQATNTISGTAYNALTIVKLNNLLFPLPPLNEQKRIVNEVDQLMTLCDELEARLSKSQTDCDRLMEAFVAEILAA